MTAVEMKTNAVGERQRGAALWNPFADMGAVARTRITIVRGEGPWVWDDHGRRYLDGTAGLWFANLGHGRRDLAEAARAQMEKIANYSMFGDYANEPAMDLADRLSALAPQPGTKVFFGSGGGDMVDTASKIARRYHAERGQPERVHLIAREHGYHGTHGFGTSVAGIPVNRDGFGPLLSDVSIVPYDDAEALEREIQRIGPDRVAAFFCEPVIGAGGVRLPPDGYIERVAEICRSHGVLLIIDSVICAFGRLGTWFGFERWPIQPDMVTLAKGITVGALPLGALLVAPHVAEPFFTGEPGAPILRHGATYSGHPTCCAVANATLDVYERENLIPRGQELEGVLADALARCLDHPLVSEVRSGLGLVAAIELSEEARAADPGIVGRFQLACREEGVLVRGLATAVAVSPPLIVGESEIDQLAEGILAGLNRLV